MVKYCECGCGGIVKTNRRFMAGGHNNKWKIGKTYEEIYGKERGKVVLNKRIVNTIELKEKMKDKLIETYKKYGKFYKKDLKKFTGYSSDKFWSVFGPLKKLAIELNVEFKTQKGVSSEERYGKEKAKICREENRLRFKGKNYEEIHGEKKAKEIKLKIGKGRKKWTKEKIVSAYLKIVKENGKIKRSDIVKFARQGMICYEQCIVNEVGSLDKLVEFSNVEFKRRTFIGRIGKYEKEIFDNIEKEKNINLIRQFTVAGKFIDGYDKNNNVAYEVDEQHHKYRTVEDYIREQKIKDTIGCEFVRISIGG